MFFLEAIIKYLKKDKFSEILEKHDEQESQNPLENIPAEDDMSETACEHLFMPIDSTGVILACSKCGEIRKKEELKDVNCFHKNLS